MDILDAVALPDEAQDPVVARSSGLRAQDFARQNPFLSTLGGTLAGTVGGGSLTAAGNVAGAMGLRKASDALYAKGKQLQTEAAPYMAPQLDYSTVNDLGSAWDFAKANAAQGVGSMLPMVAGRYLGGHALGLAAGVAPQLGENVSRIKEDPRLAGMTEGQILGAAAPTAAAQSALDYLVPGGVATNLARRGATALGTGALGRAGATVGTNMLLEGGAELGQEELGMGMHGLLNPERDTAADEHARIQSFLGGAVGGAPVGMIDAGVGYAQDKVSVKPPKPLDISQESDAILKSRKPLHPNLTDAEIGDALTQRDTQESAQAEQLAQRVKAESQSPRAQKLADEFLAGDKSGPAAEMFVREVQRADKTEKWVDKAYEAGAALREQLNKLSGGRLGSAYFDKDGQAHQTPSYLSQEFRDMSYDSPNAQPAEGMKFDEAGGVRYQKPTERAAQPPRAYGQRQVTDNQLPPIPDEARERTIDNLMLAYRSSDISKRAAAQAEAAMQINDVAEPLNKWIELNFGADFNDGEVVVPPQMLKLSDKLDVFVKTLYENKVRRGEPVPPKEMLDKVIAKINELESAPEMAHQVGKKERYDEEGGEDAELFSEIGTNALEPNILGTRKVYYGKSDKKEVPFKVGEEDAMRARAEGLAGSGMKTKPVGAWQRLKNAYPSDDVELYKKEDQLLATHAKDAWAGLEKFKSKAATEEGQQKEYNTARRLALETLDREVQFLEAEDAAPAEHSEVRGEDFRTIKPKSPNNRWAVQTEGVKTGKFYGGPEHGAVWFKRASDGVEFATSVSKLIKLGRKSDNVSGKKGVEEQKQALLAGISSFLNAKETNGEPALMGFGFKSEPKGKVELTDKLPANLKLHSGTFGDKVFTPQAQGAFDKYNRAAEKVDAAKVAHERAGKAEKWGAAQRLARAKEELAVQERELRKGTVLSVKAENLIEKAEREGYAEEAEEVRDAVDTLEKAVGDATSMDAARVALNDKINDLYDFLGRVGIDQDNKEVASDTQMMGAKGISRSLEEDFANPNKAVADRDESGEVARKAPEGSLAVSQMQVEAPRQSDPVTSKINWYAKTLLSKGVDAMVAAAKRQEGARYGEMYRMLKRVAGLDKDDPLWGKEAWKERDVDRKQASKLALQAVNQLEKPSERRLGNAMAVDIHNDLGKKGFAATHDSPIKHEGKFDWRKWIGKGEGNAAFGAGTYLSTSDGVHRSYKDQFTAKVAPSHKVNQKPYLERFLSDPNGVDPHRQYGEGAYYVLEMNGAPSDLIEDVVGAYNNAIPTEEVNQGYEVTTRYVDKSKMQPFNEDVINRVEKYAHDVADGLREFNDALKGKFRPDKAEFFGQDKSPTYEVSVNAEQDELLDWNAPLSEQSELVKKALHEFTDSTPRFVRLQEGVSSKRVRELNDELKGLYEWIKVLSNGSKKDRAELYGVGLNEFSEADYATELTTKKDRVREILSDYETNEKTGEEIYKSLTDKLGSQAKASDYLQSLGIVGHKYAASGGRNDKHPNYVIYDDSRIETNYVHFNAQSSAEIPGDKTLTEAERTEVREAILKRLGPTIDIKLSKALFGMVNGKRVPLSADWGPGSIRIAINALNPMQAGMHEAMHEFFHRLSKEEAGKEMLAVLKKAANSASVVRQLERLLADHPNALMQIKKGEPDFENERLAYMYQFWQAGALELGPETKTIFHKVMTYLRELTKLLSNDQQAELILQAFDEGKFSDKAKTSVVAKVMLADINSRNALIEKAKALAEGPIERLRKVAVSAHSTLYDSGYDDLKDIANFFWLKPGDRNADGSQGVFEARKQKSSEFLNKMNQILMKLGPKDVEAVRDALLREDGVAPKDMVQFAAYTQIRELLDKVHVYFDEAGVKRLVESMGPGARKEWEKVPKRKNYFPVVWNVMGQEGDFVADLMKYHQREIMERLQALGFDDYKETSKHLEYAQAIASRLNNTQGDVALAETTTSLGFSPIMSAVNERTLDWIVAPEMTKYRSQDLVETMTSYIMQAVKRAEYVRQAGNGGANIKTRVMNAYVKMLEKRIWAAGGTDADKLAQKMMGTYKDEYLDWNAGGVVNKPSANKYKAEDFGMTEAQLEEIKTDALKEISKYHKAIMALEGTLGHDISPTLRKLSGAAMVFQNFRLLIPTLFSSVSDPMGIVVNGGEIDDAFDALKRGLKGVYKTWTQDYGTDTATQLAEEQGWVDAGSFMETMGQTYSSLYMAGSVKRLNDGLFKWNGMEAWNKGMRVGASIAAQKFIVKHLTTPTKNSERYLKELFGEYRPELVDGKLNVNDPKVTQAVMRWVDGAILSPNAAQRPVWASDPHWALLFHMKQFTYSFHKVILKKAWDEGVIHGNAGPMLTLIAGYTPLVIAGDALRAIIMSGGDEPYWMQKGVGSTLMHGLERANLSGIPQLGLDAFAKTKNSKEGIFDATLEGAASLAGPTTSWAKDWYDKPVGEQMLRSLPLGSTWAKFSEEAPAEK